MGVREYLLRLLVNIVTSSVYCKGVMSKCGTISPGGSMLDRWLAITEVSRYRPCLSKGSLDTGAICRGGGSE